MITRRSACQIVATLLGLHPARMAAQARGTVSHFLLPTTSETLEIDFGAGAQTVSQIRLVQGAVTVTIKTADLFAALK